MNIAMPSSAPVGSSSVGRALHHGVFSPQGIGDVIADLLGLFPYERLIRLLGSVKKHISAAKAVLIALLIFDPKLLLVLLGIAAFVAFLLWLISLLSMIVVPPWLRKSLCCPEDISFDTDSNFDEPCNPRFIMTVRAKWSPKSPCRCDCCEVRQFVAMTGTFSLGGPGETPWYPGMEDMPQPPYNAVQNSIGQMVTTDDPWTLHRVGDELYMEDHRFGALKEEGPDKRELHATDPRAWMLLREPGGKERMGRRMLRYGVNAPEGGGGECTYGYTDHPSMRGGCNLQGMRRTARWKFVVVIRPKPHCGGEPMVKECTLLAGCRWVGFREGQGMFDVVPTWDPNTLRQTGTRLVPSPCLAWAGTGAGCSLGS